jgi:RNA polymerase sigma-70 factor (ECF subfamily)
MLGHFEGYRQRPGARINRDAPANSTPANPPAAITKVWNFDIQWQLITLAGGWEPLRHLRISFVPNSSLLRGGSNQQGIHMKLSIEHPGARSELSRDRLARVTDLRRGKRRLLTQQTLPPADRLSAQNSNVDSFDNTSLRETIQFAQQVDPTAFEIIYQSYAARVYGICLRMLHDPADAEDVLQQVFLQLFRKIQTFRGASAFSTWLHRLTVNMVLMGLRGKKPEIVSLDEKLSNDDQDSGPFSQIPAPDLRLAGLLDRITIQKALDELPDGYRQIFVLHDVRGYKHSEIAGMLGHSIGASKSQLHKARKRLRKLLQSAQRPRSVGAWRNHGSIAELQPREDMAHTPTGRPSCDSETNAFRIRKKLCGNEHLSFEGFALQWD